MTSDCLSWALHNVQKERCGVLWNGQKVGDLRLRVKRDERVGGLVVGRGGCECDGLMSNTLSLSILTTSTHPSMVSHSPVFQS